MKYVEILKNVAKESLTKEKFKNLLLLCDKSFIEENGTFEDVTELERIFFKILENKQYRQTKQYFELMEFKNEFIKFEELLSEEDKQKIFILEILNEVEELNQFLLNKKLRSELTANQLENIENLCAKIESIYNTKEILFFQKCNNGLKLETIESLYAFEKHLYSENYIKVQNHIMQTLKKGGIILIVVGSKGLTPQRIYGYILEETECCKCPESLIRILRKI
mgnify:FL=1